jgi:hypothetical protein
VSGVGARLAGLVGWLPHLHTTHCFPALDTSPARRCLGSCTTTAVAFHPPRASVLSVPAAVRVRSAVSRMEAVGWPHATSESPSTSSVTWSLPTDTACVKPPAPRVS